MSMPNSDYQMGLRRRTWHLWQAIVLALCVGAFGGPSSLSAQDQAVDVAGIRAQLEENAKTHPAEKASQAELESEDMRLAEQEKALLAQIEGKAQEPVPAQQASAPSAGASTSVETRAAVDLDKAIDELTAPAPSTHKASDETGIEVVVKGPLAPKKRFISDPEIQAARLSSPEQSAEASEESSFVSADKSALARSLESRMAEQDKNLISLRSSNNALRSQLQSAQSKITQLNRELSEARNRLIIAETEVERLSSVVATHGGGVIRSRPSTRESSAVRTFKPVSAESAVTAAQEAKLSGEMLIATVMAEKAHLRTGPGKDNSPLMSVTKGTRLAVETRQGEWYRVIAPTGVRAWIASEVVAFGPSSTERPSRTVQIKGFDSSREDEAVRLLSGER